MMTDIEKYDMSPMKKQMLD